MNESINIEIQFKSPSAEISPAELSLLESLLPEILREMLEAEEVSEAE